ncbi:hypothetical protein [Hymenobacter canadensis]|uniref:T9SS type A sorting domain-containing protein n=1 Tax=Hymenobacter canadensis TaxID=2999067 RepID=A0ABY7LLA1_9BACT|nr:hypothetical protein [Hymenobacter canadensis]WBA40374.1 hypothetical protein O3303_11075 [Hymenobacter canadensis]
MRTRFRIRFLLLSVLLLAGALGAHASHVLGGDLDYSYIPGSASQYRITARLYSNPADAGTLFPDPRTISLSGTQNGCASTSTSNFQLQVSRMQLTRRSLGCAVNGRSYNISQYEATVTLPPGQWTLKVIEELRSGGMLNLNNIGDQGFYITAYLDNSSGLTNNSPRFTSFTMPYVCGSQPYRYSFSTFEPDGDSLVYRSVQPLASTITEQGCGNAISYASYSSGQFQDPINGQTATYPAGQFTAGFPLLSFRSINGVAVPQFELNAANGDLLTTPVAARGLNTVAVQVDEYRRLNGSWTRIGGVMRDVVYSVFDANGNRNPGFTGLQIAGTSQPIDQPIVVQRGQQIALTLTATDPDAGQTVQISSDVAAVIPGASFQLQGASQAVLSWQVPATLPAGRYSFTVSVADNNCPTSGSEVRTINFVLPARALATAGARAQVLAAYPMPFRSQVQFRLPTPGVQAIHITDGLGRLVATLHSRPDGTVAWSPAADVPAGAYFARPASGEAVFRLLRQ